MHPDPETFTLIDFDNSEYGYRAWDFAYYFVHWHQWPTVEQQRQLIYFFIKSYAFFRDLFDSYVTQWNASNDSQLTVENLFQEMAEIAPYTLMQQMLFHVSPGNPWEKFSKFNNGGISNPGLFKWNL